MWEPSENSFADQEDAITDFRVEIISSDTIARRRRIIISFCTGEYDAVYFTDDNNFFNTLNDNFNMDRVRVLKVRHGVTLESLSQKWLISPEAARRIV